MIKKLLFGCLILASLNACKKQVALVLTNPVAFDRMDEQVVVLKEKLVEIIGEVDTSQSFKVFDGETNIPFQLDDIDGDASWDVMAMVLDFKASEEKTLSIEIVAKNETLAFDARTNVRFALKNGTDYTESTSGERVKGMDNTFSGAAFQMEGPGWENDKVAFRNYFDERNGMDIFGKISGKMILDEVGIKSDYHKLQPWGMDILKVGNSLGAGAIALWINDSLYRIGPACRGNFKVIAEGPLRSIVEFSFDSIMIDQRIISVKHHVSIWAGSYAYQAKAWVKGLSENDRLAVGIVNMKNDSLYTNDFAGNYKSFCIHGPNAIEGEYLGMGVLVHNDGFEKVLKTPSQGDGIIQSSVIVLKQYDCKKGCSKTCAQQQSCCKKVASCNCFCYRFYAGWEVSVPMFADRGSFIDIMAQDANKLAEPILIK